MQPGRLAGVEVDDQPVGVAGLPVAADRPLVHVQLERGQVDQPGERGEVVDDREDEGAVARLDAVREPVVGTFAVRTQDGVPAGDVLLEEAHVLDAVRPADPGDRAVLEVRQQHRRDLGVVVEHLALGGAGARVEHLVEVADLEGAALDVDEDLLRLDFSFGTPSARPRSPGPAPGRDRRISLTDEPPRRAHAAGGRAGAVDVQEDAGAAVPDLLDVEVGDDRALVLLRGSRSAARSVSGSLVGSHQRKPPSAWLR